MSENDFLLGPETFESGSLPFSFSSYTSGQNGTISVDDTGKISGDKSIACSSPDGWGWAYLQKDFSTALSEVYLKFKSIPPSLTDMSASWFHNVRFWGSTYEIGRTTFSRISASENLDYGGLFNEDTLDFFSLASATIHDIQIYLKIHSSQGRVKVWLNNSDSSDPDFDSENIDTGSTNIASVKIGLPMAPAALTNVLYLDDVIIDDSFIDISTPAGNFFIKLNDVFVPFTPKIKIDGDFKSVKIS